MFDHIGKAMTIAFIIVGVVGAIISGGFYSLYTYRQESALGITLDDIAKQKEVCEQSIPRKKECVPYVKFVIRDKEGK